MWDKDRIIIRIGMHKNFFFHHFDTWNFDKDRIINQAVRHHCG